MRGLPTIEVEAEERLEILVALEQTPRRLCEEMLEAVEHPFGMYLFADCHRL